MKSSNTLGSLRKDEVCIYKPEPNWFDVREAINEMLRNQNEIS